MPACAVGADLELSRERAFGDLAIDSGSGQPGSGENGFQAYDAIRFAHGWPAFCWLFLTAPEIRQDKHITAGKMVFRLIAAWGKASGKKDRSNSEAPASAEVDAMSEGQLLTEPAA